MIPDGQSTQNKEVYSLYKTDWWGGNHNLRLGGTQSQAPHHLWYEICTTLIVTAMQKQPILFAAEPNQLGNARLLH